MKGIGRADLVALWLLAAAAGGRFGIWLTVGVVAAILGMIVLALDQASCHSLRRPAPRLVLIGAAAGGLMSAATYFVYPLLGRIAPFIASGTALLYVVFLGPSPVVAAVALVPIILGEETGLERRCSDRRGGPFRSPARRDRGRDRLRAGPRAAGLASLVLVALVCGVSWGALRIVTGSLVPTLVAHLVWDALLLLGLPLVYS